MAMKVGGASLLAQRDFSREPRERSSKLGPGEEYSIALVEPLDDPDADRILAYIIHLSPQGYMVVSSDTDITPVIAYSYRSDLITEDSPQNIPLHMVTWDMQNRLDAIPLTSAPIKRENNEEWKKFLAEDALFLRKMGKLATFGPWLDTTWGQSGIYDDKCPIDPQTGQRSYTGCVATAMAQIINHWEFPPSVSFSSPADDYVSSLFTTPDIFIDADAGAYGFPSFPALSASLSSIDYNGNGCHPTDGTIANLMFACGVSVRMQYSSSGSGASSWDVAPALLNKFGYSIANWLDSAHTNFYLLLQVNNANDHPAMLRITETGTQYGHALVCDGYRDTDGTYHLNFGWNGSGDGWYSLPDGMPYGFDTVEGGTLSIMAYLSTRTPTPTPTPGPKLAILKKEGTGDVNLYYYRSLVDGDRTYWDAHARNPSALARDMWMVPSGNDAVGMTRIQGPQRDRLLVLKEEGAGDINLYLYRGLADGDWTYWDAYARNLSPRARDMWVIPAGNDAIGIATVADMNEDGDDDLAVLKKEGAGDVNLYYYNAPVAGDWVYWDAHARNPTPLARDLWIMPAGNDAIGLTAIGIDAGRGLAILKKEGAGDVNLYVYNNLVEGDRTYWDCFARNPSALARDMWLMPAGNDAIGLTAIDADNDGKEDLAILKKEGAGDVNLYYYNALVPGDWLYWDAVARNPSALARDLWVIPVGNDAIALTVVDME